MIPWKRISPQGAGMEISPIIGIRNLPTVKVPPAEAGISADFEIKAAVGLGDDSYTGSGKKAAGGDEPEDEELDYEDATEESEKHAYGSSTGISYFA